MCEQIRCVLGARNLINPHFSSRDLFLHPKLLHREVLDAARSRALDHPPSNRRIRCRNKATLLPAVLDHLTDAEAFSSAFIDSVHFRFTRGQRYALLRSGPERPSGGKEGPLRLWCCAWSFTQPPQSESVSTVTSRGVFCQMYS